MKSTIKHTAAGVGALAVIGGAFLAAATAANAADSPLPWQSTEAANHEQAGTLTFYNASGAPVTSGNLSDPLAAYAVASGGPLSSDDLSTGAGTFVATPSLSDPALWSNWSLSLTAPVAADNSVNQGYTSLPASIQSSNKIVVPLLESSPGDDESIGQAITNYPSTYASPNNNVYEIRTIASNPNTFYAADIEVNKTAGTWALIYPAAKPVVATSVTNVAANPASPAPSGTTSVALSAKLAATDGTVPAGAVELFDGSTDKGAATVDASGNVTDTVTGLTDGSSHSYQFTFTPSDSTSYSGSQSSALAYTVKAPAATTQTIVTGGSTATAGTATDYTATVSNQSGSATPTGSVVFSVDGTPLAGSVTLANGAAVKSITFGSPGSHTVTAAYTSSDTDQFKNSSDSTGQSVTVGGVSVDGQPDPQNVKVNVPAGAITISTPYTPATPLDLGKLVLNADGTGYDSDAEEATTGNQPAKFDKVTIFDGRANSQGWNASVKSDGFSDGSGDTIAPNWMSFKNVAAQGIAGNNLSASDVTPTDIAQFSSTSQEFARTAKGPGSVYVLGDVALNQVPTSVVAGDYTATITFTIVGH